MSKELKGKTFIGKVKRLIPKILIIGVVLVLFFFVSFLLIGYHAASKPISYLPVIHSGDLRSDQSGVTPLALKNRGYILLVNKKGEISVRSVDGEEIMSNLQYYSSYEKIKEKWGLDKISASLSSDSTIIIKGEGLSGTQVTLVLTVPKDQPLLRVSVKTIYNNKTIVNRESLVAAFDVPVTEVYKKNRQSDLDSFDQEYWLQKQGVKLGTGSRSVLVYHTPNVSSLQLDTRHDLLFVNLDYSMDHLFFNIPYQEDNGGKWVDQSTSEYSRGQERDNNFNIYFGEINQDVPRFMLVPNGYLAGYVFTEHADGGTLKTNRAAYFGSEDITNLDKAVAGFAFHKIPTTKSVFYADPDKAPYSSIRDDAEHPQFLDFLDQLKRSGLYEICLHTPENLSSNRQLLEESINFMKTRFGTETWIDHGMFSGKINRETLVADGMDPKSEFYTADLWEKFNTHYFWSAAVEELRKYSLKQSCMDFKFYNASENLWRTYLSPDDLKSLSFFNAGKKLVQGLKCDKEELNSLLPVKGDAFPTPLFWQHPTRTRKFYSWVTDYFRSYNHLSDKRVKSEELQLNKLITDWGVFINHGYFVRNIENVDVTIKSNGKLVINPYFDKILGNMALMRDEGQLGISTIRDIMGYWIAVDNVSFEYMPNGVVYVRNNNDKPISGLSLVIHGKNVLVNGQVPKLKRVDNNTIFWFDIQAGGSAVLSFPATLL